MDHLILIRHSISQPQPGASAHTWQLTEAGRARCAALADRLRPYQIQQTFSSDEPKALATARLLAENSADTGTHVVADVRLRETTRHTVPYFEDITAFQGAIRRAMEKPNERLFGEEAFSDALARFSQAIEDIVTASPGKTSAVVTHGTVLSLYIANQTGLDAFAVWRLLEMPAFVVFTLPERKLREICFSLPF